MLQAFIELANTQNFTRAAERCHVSQPTLSAMISKLEDGVGIKLFVRDTRSVTLTPEGELFVEKARKIYDDIEASVVELKAYARQQKGEICIAALPTVASACLPEIIASYRRRHTDVRVNMYDMLSDRCLNMLRSGKAELAITALGVDDTEFNTSLVYQDPFVLVCHKSHKFVGQESVSWSELSGEAFVQFPTTSSIRQFLDDTADPLNMAQDSLEVEGLTTAASLVASGHGVSVVPELAKEFFNRPEICVIQLQDSKLVRDIFVVTNKGRRLSTASRGFLELINEYFRKKSKN